MNNDLLIEPRRKKRVVVLHEHEVLREGLCVLIARQDDFEVVASFGSPAQASYLMAQLRADLVIAGNWSVDDTTSTLLSELIRLAPVSRKVILAQHTSEECVRSALLAGVDALVDLNSSLAELIAALRSVCNGRHFVCNATATQILSSVVSSGGSTSTALSVAAPITGREREVLTRVALGSSNKSIARELGLSPKTVEKHRSNVMRKLQLHNAAAITMYAIRNGMTSPYLHRSREEVRATGTHH